MKKAANRFSIDRINYLDKDIQALKDADIEIYDFSRDNLLESSPGIVRNFTKRAIDKRRESGFPDFDQSLEFRQDVAKWIESRFEVIIDVEKEIFPTFDTRNTVFSIAQSLLSQNDVVLTVNPTEDLFSQASLSMRAKPHKLTWELKLDEIPNNVLKKTKLMWLQNPNNPTAKFLDKDELAKIASFCKENKIILIVDESYIELYYKDKTCSVLEISTENILAINSLSYRSCMPTYNIGFIVGDKTLIETYRDFATATGSIPSQFIMDAAGLALSDESYVQVIRETMKRKRELMVRALYETGMQKCLPRAGPFIWQKVPEGMTSTDLAVKLLSPNVGILVTSGCVYEGGEGYVKLSLTPSVHDCKLAAEKIRNLKI